MYGGAHKPVLPNSLTPGQLRLSNAQPIASLVIPKTYQRSAAPEASKDPKRLSVCTFSNNCVGANTPVEALAQTNKHIDFIGDPGRIRTCDLQLSLTVSEKF